MDVTKEISPISLMRDYNDYKAGKVSDGRSDKLSSPGLLKINSERMKVVLDSCLFNCSK